MRPEAVVRPARTRAIVLLAVLFFGGWQLFILGVVGEYIARIYDEVKDRPLYLVRELVNFGDDAGDPLDVAARPEARDAV